MTHFSSGHKTVIEFPSRWAAVIHEFNLFIPDVNLPLYQSSSANGQIYQQNMLAF